MHCGMHAFGFIAGIAVHVLSDRQSYSISPCMHHMIYGVWLNVLTQYGLQANN